jgi:fumarylacetoacetate (FAA) hydrolase
MKLVSFIQNGKERAGIILHEKVFALSDIKPDLPNTMMECLASWEHIYPELAKFSQEIQTGGHLKSKGISLTGLQLLAPLPNPNSLRDGYAFRQHVATARRNRGLDMTPVFDSYPVFYFGNHRTVYGEGEVQCMPDHFNKLDFELEAGIVISKKGKNIPASEGDDYIAGLMILNDFSARTLQMEEMLLNLGPAKGKDFLTTTGPWLVTLDELKKYETTPPKNHIGKSWKLSMSASVNGKLVSSGNLGEMDWTFAELIERASYGVELYPGDIVGSGTVGTGCFLELNGTGKLHDPSFKEQWLMPGDEIELNIEALGSLKNRISAEKTDYSILQLKK